MKRIQNKVHIIIGKREEVKKAVKFQFFVLFLLNIYRISERERTYSHTIFFTYFVY